ncbi:hypothetical protein RVR34_02005 [Microcystis aeruginosa FBCC-A68]|uniref:hypothetical protein n=1 Tax=Microcystis aeruginosa TaxID=1126 RepID=UPI001BAEA88A|nr:hypothetical protein [Microcystis aeruginosa]
MSEDLIKLLEQFLHDNELEWEWFEKIESFCKSYSLNIKYITEVLNDPKVIPMIRGKFFEFTVQDELSKILANNYLVTNPRLNPRLFGLCYAMDGGYKGWNRYIERHLAIFVNCF